MEPVKCRQGEEMVLMKIEKDTGLRKASKLSLESVFTDSL